MDMWQKIGLQLKSNLKSNWIWILRFLFSTSRRNARCTLLLTVGFSLSFKLIKILHILFLKPLYIKKI